MLYSLSMIQKKYPELHDIYKKIKILLREKKLFKLKRGLYEDNPHISNFELAGILYGPSYISFRSALSYYGLIPERVFTVTSATCRKNRHKTFENDFGRFSYRDVPLSAFRFEIEHMKRDYPFWMASPEKALCDLLYTEQPMPSFEFFERLLFQDLRIDEDGFDKLDFKKLKELSTLYPGRNLRFLKQLVERREQYAA